MLFWRRDGEELHEGVDVEETLPNHDGSFQSSAHLDPPSDDWQRYECVFQLAGVKEDVVTRLNKAAVRSNSDPVNTNTIISIILAVVAALLLLGGGVAGFLVYRKKQEGSDSSSSADSEAPRSADSEAPRSADSESPTCYIKVPQSEGSGGQSSGSTGSDESLNTDTVSSCSDDSGGSQASDTLLMKHC